MFFSSSFSFYPKSLILFSFDHVFVWIHVFLLALRVFGILVVSAEPTEEFKVFWAASLLCAIRFYKMLYKKNICASVILHRPLLSPAAGEQIYFPGECQCEFCIIDTATSNLTAPDHLSPPGGYWVFDLGSVSIWAPAEKENCKEVMPCCFQYPQRAGKFRLHSGFWEIQMVRGQARLGRHVGNRLKPHQDEKNLHSEYTIHIGRTQKSWGKDYHTSTWSWRFTVSTLKLKSVIELNVRKSANQLSDRHSNRNVSIAQHYAPHTLIYFTCRSCGSHNLVDLKKWKWKEEYKLLWGSYFSLVV